jgi:RHS repeat-associated protein
MTYDALGRQTTDTERCGSGNELTTTTDRFYAAASDSAFGKIVTRTRAPTGVASWSYGDVLGRGSFSRGRTFGGGFAESFTLYDRWGRKSQESAPRDSSSVDPAFVTKTDYDEADRVTSIARDIGSIDGTLATHRAIETFSYHGTTVRTEHNVDGEDGAQLHQQPREETKNVLGKVSFVTDANGAYIGFSYDADGNLTDTSHNGVTGTHNEYFVRGWRKLARDPDLGEWHYTYTTFGELETQTDAMGKTVTMAYDALGRMTSRTDDSGEAQWVYDKAPGAGIGKLAATVSAADERLNGTCTAPYDLPSGETRAVRSLTYTDFGDVLDEADCTDGDTFVTSHAYDAFGRDGVLTYPQVGASRLALRYNYTSLGFLHFVSDDTDGSLYWAATARDASGQVTSEYTRNGVETTATRSQATGWLLGSQSVAHADGDTLIQNWTYSFDEVGNLRHRSRADAVNGAPSSETFTYDQLNRLRTSAVTVGSDTYNDTYDIDLFGNIMTKGGQSYTFGAAGGCPTGGPHAVCTIGGGAPYQYDGNGNMVSGGDRTVTYDLANKATHIQSGTNGVDFIYGSDGNRVVQETTDGSSTGRTVYVGLGTSGRSLYERASKNGAVEHTHFLYAGGAHGANAFAIKVVHEGAATASSSLSFYSFDHLGSVTAVSDEQGHVLSAAWGGSAATVAGYDPWGTRRSPDGRPADPASLQLLPGHREFTGHETIPGVGLVNMNGRVYDPAIGRFLSPDPNVQLIADLQSYNRYSYVLNNPLRYTDPTGYLSSGVTDFIKDVTIAAAIATVCVYSVGACALIAFAQYDYMMWTMAHADATSDTVLMANLVGMAAGFIAGAGVGVVVADDAPIWQQMVGGAVSGMMSAEVTALATAQSLGGDKLIMAGISGAVSSGVSAGLHGLSQVSQASHAEAEGEDVPNATTSTPPDLAAAYEFMEWGGGYQLSDPTTMFGPDSPGDGSQQFAWGYPPCCRNLKQATDSPPVYAPPAVGPSTAYRPSPMQLRAPDFIIINVGIGEVIAWNGTISLNRYGDVFWSPLGGSLGKTMHIVSGSAMAVWMMQDYTPTRGELNNFMTSHGFGITVGAGVGVSESWTPGSDFAPGVGLATPQIGISYNYSWYLRNFDVHW